MVQEGPKVRVRKTRENPMDNPKEPKVRTKVLKAHTKAKRRKLVSQVLKSQNQRQAPTFGHLHRHAPWTLPGSMVGVVTKGTMAGVLMNGTVTGVLWDGTNKRMTLRQAHFHLVFGCQCHV